MWMNANFLKVDEDKTVVYFEKIEEYRLYPVMPDRASRNSTRAVSGGFQVGLRKRSSVRYSRRSHRQTTVQNYAARLVVCCDRRNHITPVLKKLHWLPVKQL